MNVRLPYSRKKRYLTGIDWVIAALDRMSRRATGGSNASQIVLELNGSFDAPQFAKAMAAFAGLFPVLGGRSTRDWNLAPYWRIPRRAAGGCARIAIQDVAPGEMGSALERNVNASFERSGEHLAFQVIREGANTGPRRR